MDEKNRNVILVFGFIILLLVGMGCGWYLGVTFANKEENTNKKIENDNSNDDNHNSEKENDNGLNNDKTEGNSNNQQPNYEERQTDIIEKDNSKQFLLGGFDTEESYNGISVKAVVVSKEEMYPVYNISINNKVVFNDSKMNYKSFEIFHNYVIVNYNIDISDWSQGLAIYDVNTQKIIADYSTMQGYKEQKLYFTNYSIKENSIYLTFKECGDQCGVYLIDNGPQEELCSRYEKYKNVILVRVEYKMNYSDGKLSELIPSEKYYFKDLTKENISAEGLFEFDGYSYYSDCLKNS